MFDGNEKLRGAGEIIEMTPDQVREWARCKEDIIYFASKYFFIIDLNDGRKPIPLRHYQKKILKAFVKPPNNKKNVAVMMGRQGSKTTLITIYATHYVLFNMDKKGAILANKEKMSLEIMDRIRMAYSELPLWLQQGLMEWSKSKIVLENGCSIEGSATGSESIRGKSFSLLCLDEFAFVPPGSYEGFMNATYPTTASVKDSRIIITTTPNGLNHFYELWKKSVEGKNSYYPIKVNWDEIPGRDEEWKQRYIEDRGVLSFRQEISCFWNKEKVTIKDKETGNIQTLTFEELKELIEYER